jgi:hypothetical protein
VRDRVGDGGAERGIFDLRQADLHVLRKRQRAHPWRQLARERRHWRDAAGPEADVTHSEAARSEARADFLGQERQLLRPDRGFRHHAEHTRLERARRGASRDAFADHFHPGLAIDGDSGAISRGDSRAGEQRTDELRASARGGHRPRP